MQYVLYPVKDLDKAKALFAALFGAGPHVDSPYYVGFSVNGAEIGLVPDGHDQGMTGPIPFFDVDDISATLEPSRPPARAGGSSADRRGLRAACREDQRRRR